VLHGEVAARKALKQYLSGADDKKGTGCTKKEEEKKQACEEGDG
jgi:hypothetical protein